MFGIIPLLWMVSVKAVLTAVANRVIFRKAGAAAEPSFNEWLRENRGRNPAAICRGITERLTYLVDPLHGIIDYVSAPALSWARRWGDCDDFSYLAAHALTAAGYRTWVATYITWNLRSSHTVCIARIDCKYRVFDQELRKPAFETLSEAVDYTRGLLPPVMTRLVTRYRGFLDVPGRIAAGKPRR